MATNPYRPPVEFDRQEQSRLTQRRFAFLLLPPLIPVCVHFVIRLFLPADENLYHSLFSFVALMVAWIWAMSMADRFGLTPWKTYFLTCLACGLVFAATVLAPTIVDCLPFDL